MRRSDINLTGLKNKNEDFKSVLIGNLSLIANSL